MKKDILMCVLVLTTATRSIFSPLKEAVTLFQSAFQGERVRVSCPLNDKMKASYF